MWITAYLLCAASAHAWTIVNAVGHIYCNGRMIYAEDVRTWTPTASLSFLSDHPIPDQADTHRIGLQDPQHEYAVAVRQRDRAGHVVVTWSSMRHKVGREWKICGPI
ncbi:hypothetical protein PYCC9005_002811 [Savitreella phatthalungensis]